MPRILIATSVFIAAMVLLPLSHALERKDNQPLYKPGTKSVLLRYSIQVPEHKPGDPPLPLMILFHGTNLSGEKEVTWTDEVLEVMGLRDSVILIGPEGGKGKGPWKGKEAAAAELLAWAKRELPVDHRRVVFAGFSAGAYFISERLLTQHHKELAGATAFAGCSHKAYAPHQPGDPDVILIMGSNDKPGPARKWASVMRQAGHRLVYREIIGAGHGTVLGLPNTRESRNRQDLITWSLGQRCGHIPPAEHELAFLQKLAKAKGRPQAAEVMEVARIGGAEAGQLVNSWLMSDDSGLQLAAARISQDTVFAGATIPGLAQVAASDNAEAAQAAAVALGRLAAWRYQDAQQALIQLAEQREARTRGMAAMGLKDAIAFTIYGQHEDQHLFVPLIRMLEDKDSAVRQLAWAALSQKMPPVENNKGKPVTLSPPMTYDPAKDPAAQREIIGEWQKWARGLKQSL